MGKPNFGMLSLMAGTAGAIGAFVGTPAEVALVRMSADGRLPPGIIIIYHLIVFLYFNISFHSFLISATIRNFDIIFYTEQRRNYKNVFNAFTRISREEGVTTLWRGSVATMGRAVVVNVSQLATYSQTKFLISSKGIYPIFRFFSFFMALF